MILEHKDNQRNNHIDFNAYNILTDRIYNSITFKVNNIPNRLWIEPKTFCFTPQCFTNFPAYGVHFSLDFAFSCNFQVSKLNTSLETTLKIIFLLILQHLRMFSFILNFIHFNAYKFIPASIDNSIIYQVKNCSKKSKSRWKCILKGSLVGKALASKAEGPWFKSQSIPYIFRLKHS